MNIHSKEAVVFLVQVDHLTGECIGQTIELFYNVGASNVQVMSSVTKKNRPSYVFLIDCRLEYKEAIEQVIVTELGSGGWHVIHTEHCYQYNKILKKEIVVKDCKTNKTLVFLAEGKKFENGSLRPENDSVVELKRVILEQFKKTVSYSALYNFILSAFEGNVQEVML